MAVDVNSLNTMVYAIRKPPCSVRMIIIVRVYAGVGSSQGIYVAVDNSWSRLQWERKEDVNTTRRRSQ